jgi:Fe-S cluster assembly ATP-binding protein
MTNVLEIKHLCVEVGGVEILHNLDLTIPEGEVHALLGPNASGKTTLMMAIMGYPKYEITKGQIFFHEENITESDVTVRARLGIGFSQQRPPTITGVKLQQLLDFVVGKTPERTQEIDKMVKTFQMEEFLSRDINSGPSGGEIKRSELFQLLITRPKFVMMDEPDSGVDLEALAVVGNMANALLSKEHARPVHRKAGLIVTHTGSILDYVYTDQAHVMLCGDIGCSGNPRILLNHIREHGYEECIRCINSGELRNDE